ncbi:tryptophan 7-halogenase [Sphingomonas sp. F9_3S_D5_B_2]
MVRPIERVVIAGGGTAGWLSACRLAAWSKAEGRHLQITLIEAPDIPTVGVGEGTWPTMRQTLAEIGIDETDFLSQADGAFKQGSRFAGWRNGAANDIYTHPFTPPPAARDPRQLVAAWRALPDRSFASVMTAQETVTEASLAPRQRGMPPYAGALNYAYHLDAGKFVDLLRRHAMQRLGVTHMSDRIASIEDRSDGDIAAIVTASGERLDGDLFIDCTGHAAVLIQTHCKSEWVDRSDCLFNDRALAAQVPVAADSPVPSQTIATAHRAGWLWDIGLPARRGIGCVYSSKFLDDSHAEQILADYIARAVPKAEAVQPRRLIFPTGHRARFWDRNCVAMGLSAGFAEPLEASAIVLIELSLQALIDNFPSSSAAMCVIAKRFNELFLKRWERIIEFLKLHYVLSERPEPYWQAHRDPATFPERLADLLSLWQQQSPSAYDLPLAEEIFPAASYQYVYYGMGGAIPRDLPEPSGALMSQLDQLSKRGRALVASLPTNRAYLDSLKTDPQRGAEGRA